MGDAGKVAKMDDVSKIAIWREQLLKEKKFMRINENFSISTPHALKTITEKPQLVNPLTQVDAAMTETARLRLNELSQLKDTNKLPSERFKVPLTTNQEYGWTPKPLLEPNPQFSRTLTQCDVTNYANAYAAMNGRSPYATKMGANVADGKKG